jgi:hypothetical protein
LGSIDFGEELGCDFVCVAINLVADPGRVRVDFHLHPLSLDELREASNLEYQVVEEERFNCENVGENTN